MTASVKEEVILVTSFDTDTCETNARSGAWVVELQESHELHSEVSCTTARSQVARQSLGCGGSRSLCSFQHNVKTPQFCTDDE
jgi:hypothetical protein